MNVSQAQPGIAQTAADNKPTYVKVNVRYDESPAITLTVNVNPNN